MYFGGAMKQNSSCKIHSLVVSSLVAISSIQKGMHEEKKKKKNYTIFTIFWIETQTPNSLLFLN